MKINKIPTTFRLNKETVDNINVICQKLSKKSNVKLSKGEIIDLLVKNAIEKDLNVTVKFI